MLLVENVKEKIKTFIGLLPRTNANILVFSFLVLFKKRGSSYHIHGRAYFSHLIAFFLCCNP